MNPDTWSVAGRIEERPQPGGRGSSRLLSRGDIVATISARRRRRKNMSEREPGNSACGMLLRGRLAPLAPSHFPERDPRAADLAARTSLLAADTPLGGRSVPRSCCSLGVAPQLAARAADDGAAAAALRAARAPHCAKRWRRGPG